ncbi:transketolase [uncultured Sphaerochaeta sp.]|uniref:transketolase n=1 Tax=uncultured Sphaerochaeta sp. TaxID=886478 RepID=UPI002A0A217D|nr:transketolase [uncultured Sphaerochaeta sp.]
MTSQELRAMSFRIRREILTMALHAGPNGAHVGPAMSLVEILAVLYGSVLNLDRTNPQWSERDRVYLSKGHGALAYYAALHEVGFLTHEELETYDDNAGILPAQPSRYPEKGIEFSSGSLGLGLSPAIGSSLAARSRKQSYRTIVLLGNGECNEGTIWEAAISAASYHLDNLIAVVDNNGIQSDGFSIDVLDMGNIAQKWKSFGWEVRCVDGHNVQELFSAFTTPWSGSPLIIIANTVKGKGVSFMENNKDWHHNRLTKELYDIAMKEQGALDEA